MKFKHAILLAIAIISMILSLSALRVALVGWPNDHDCAYRVDGLLPQDAPCEWTHIAGSDTGLSLTDKAHTFNVQISGGMQEWQRNPYGLAPIRFDTARGWVLETRFRLRSGTDTDAWPTWDDWSIAFSQFSTVPPHESWNLIVVANRTQFRVVLSNSTTYAALAVQSPTYPIGGYHTVRYAGVPCDTCTGSRKVMEFRLLVDEILVGTTGDTWRAAPDAVRMSVRNYGPVFNVDFNYWFYELEGP